MSFSLNSFVAPPSAPGIPSSTPQPATQTARETAPKSTLYMGELAPWMDESYIRSIWSSLGEQVNVKMIKDRFTGQPAGYCFIEFSNPVAAQKALSYNGLPVAGTDRTFKLNWATGGGLNDRKDERPPEYSIFVGDLDPMVTDQVLLVMFQTRYHSCKSAKIMTDPITNQSRGYGFVRFSDEAERNRALVEMHGVFCGQRPMRISMALPKSKSDTTAPLQRHPLHHQQPPLQQQQQQQQQFPALSQPMVHHVSQQLPPSLAQHPSQSQQPQSSNTVFGNADQSATNTTVFVGGLSSTVREDELRAVFAPFGEITYVKIPQGKGCGFVQYVHRASAEMAISQMNSALLGGSRIRLSWGRSQQDKSASAPGGGATLGSRHPSSGSATSFGSSSIGSGFMSPTGARGLASSLGMMMGNGGMAVNNFGPGEMGLGTVAHNIGVGVGSGISTPTSATFGNVSAAGGLSTLGGAGANPFPPVTTTAALHPTSMHQFQLQHPPQSQSQSQPPSQQQELGEGPLDAVAHLPPSLLDSLDPTYMNDGYNLPTSAPSGNGKDGFLERMEADGVSWRGIHCQ
ncbi:uncharacterized protein VTP21DRAFT_7633 [Calcarisporiella thermophila]|uniref:uncharacterized protein n=1 Tax=Calcarisporiella thermophila TaxID=911321 RepID=UPI0037443AAB